MRKSQIVLLSAAGTIVGFIIIVVAIGRFALSQADPGAADAERRSRGAAGPQVSRSFDLEGFQGLEIEGTWRINISRGSEWRVEASYPEGIENEIEIDVRGGALRLNRNEDVSWRWWGSEDATITADIVMPELARLSLAGASQLDFASFTGPRLEIDIAGAAQLNGSDGAFDELALSVSGASQIDLRGVAVTDARVDLAGASDINLNMNGGVLTGSMAGAGSILYSGTVREQSVDIAGFGHVSRAD